MMNVTKAEGNQQDCIHRPSDPHVKDIAEEHPDWFVHKADGSLFTSHGFYVLDTTNDEAVDNMVRKLYRGLKEQGWDYVTGKKRPPFELFRRPQRR